MDQNDIRVTVESVDRVRVKLGSAKAFRAHIIGPDFEHHAEADSYQEALVLAAMRWHKYSK